ncbi:MAG: hypothetical protein ACLFQK_01730 [Fibrobacterota bacterium]
MLIFLIIILLSSIIYSAPPAGALNKSNTATLQDDVKRGTKENALIEPISGKNCFIKPGWSISVLPVFKKYYSSVSRIRDSLVSDPASSGDTSYVRFSRQNLDIFFDSLLNYFPVTAGIEIPVGNGLRAGLAVSYFYNSAENEYTIFEKKTVSGIPVYTDTASSRGKVYDKIEFTALPVFFHMSAFLPPDIISIDDFRYFYISCGAVFLPYSKLRSVHRRKLSLAPLSCCDPIKKIQINASGSIAAGPFFALGASKVLSKLWTMGGEITFFSMTVKELKENEKTIRYKDFLPYSSSSDKTEFELSTASFAFRFSRHF